MLAFATHVNRAFAEDDHQMIVGIAEGWLVLVVAQRADDDGDVQRLAEQLKLLRGDHGDEVLLVPVSSVELNRFSSAMTAADPVTTQKWLHELSRQCGPRVHVGRRMPERLVGVESFMRGPVICLLDSRRVESATEYRWSPTQPRLHPRGGDKTDAAQALTITINERWSARPCERRMKHSV